MGHLNTTANTVWVYVLCFLLVVFTGCNEAPLNSSPVAGDDSQDEFTPVSLQLNWFPEAEHGGYYAALVHGYFEDEGLDVTILSGGPNVPVVQSLAAQRIDFAVTNADRVLLGREAGANIVALMAPIQNTPRCIMVHKESGIEKLEDLNDVTLAIGAGPAFFQYMQLRLPLENVETIAYPGSIGPFVANKRFAQQAYVFSEPFLALQQGAEPVALMLSEIGYNPYASLLVTKDETAADRKDLTQRVVRASIRGWEKYVSDPATTNEHIASLNPDMDIPTLEFGVAEIRKLSGVSEDAALNCAMTAERWQMLLDQLSEIELVDPQNVSVSEVFSSEFTTPATPQKQ